jgi:4-hydroxy-tetrahydrodipicolinate reductase
MADVIKLGVVGCLGRMGQTIVAAIEAADGLDFIAGCDVATHPQIGTFAPGTKVTVSADTKSVFAAADVVVDFTPPGNTAAHAALAAETGTALIVGTTGLSADDHSALDQAARDTVVLQAGNFSLGINLLLGLAKQAAAKLGPDWDIEILEMHHRDKIDAPSGTALMLGEAAAEGRGAPLDDLRADVHDGITGARKTGSIGFAALRGGSVIGEHDVIFASSSERITLSHKAENRMLFAAGAVRGALWAAGQKAGRYTVADMLGL